MGDVISLQNRRSQKQLQSFGEMVYNMFDTLFSFMIQYVVQPLWAAYATASLNRPIILQKV